MSEREALVATLKTITQNIPTYAKKFTNVQITADFAARLIDALSAPQQEPVAHLPKNALDFIGDKNITTIYKDECGSVTFPIYGPDLLAAYDRVAAERDAAVKVRQDYDRWLSKGVYYTTEECTKFAAERRAELDRAITRAEAADRQLAEVVADVEKLREEKQRIWESGITLERQLAELQAKHDALVKDAERYRWLRENNEQHCDEELPHVTVNTQDIWGKWYSKFLEPEELDAAIDAAMSAVALDKGGE